MLPIPNPFKPEEHEPWCPLGIVELMCNIIGNCYLFVMQFALVVVRFN